ncbi:MAG: hypothetical protein R3E91_00435 [Chlamydiales bacterium]
MSIFLNKLLLAIFVLGLFFSSPLQGAHLIPINDLKNESLKEEWVKFDSKKDGFSVNLPKKPEHVEQTIDVPNTDLKISYDTYLSEPNENIVYVISVWHYPVQVDMSKPEVNLQDGFTGMLSALPGSEILNIKMSELQGYKSLEFLVENEDVYFQGMLILVHNTLYQVFTVYKNTIDVKNDCMHFIESFNLVNPEQQKLNGQRNGEVNF